MTPLIEIKNVPIEIEMKISHAQLKYTRGTADLEISKDHSGMHIKSKPIQVSMDTFHSQGIVIPTTRNSLETNRTQGKTATYEATASYAQQGQELLLNAKIDQHLLSQLSYTNPIKADAPPVLDTNFTHLLEPQDAEMNIRFEMDKLNFDMRLSTQEFEFTPGDIEFSVSQRPEIIITYIGGPIYVPPSSDPNYEPVDVQA